MLSRTSLILYRSCSSSGIRSLALTLRTSDTRQSTLDTPEPDDSPIAYPSKVCLWFPGHEKNKFFNPLFRYEVDCMGVHIIYSLRGLSGATVTRGLSYFWSGSGWYNNSVFVSDMVTPNRSVTRATIIDEQRSAIQCTSYIYHVGV